MQALPNAPVPNLLGLPIHREEALRGAAYAVLLFAGLGTLTAIWQNSLFIRMTPTTPLDWVILAAESLLVGLFFAVRVAGCSIKKASLGGILGFLGFGCALCNKLLVVIFSATLLTQYFEPIRHYVGAIGLVVLMLALRSKLRIRKATQNAEAGPLD